ncbi:ABC transporter permease [Hydrogenimonas thermophila]|uniref:Transport permease protein n=1 Tax=Hydrogenimonas thermophila TaxID=223786 RepID=A0A1I5KS43_9BACT|nr:ABC transporter permease [Hydrogenimonas thermophila]SFO87835.1 lipopolysaccharide transport system permease protein [Hydrogenimonas thermophila]
MKHNILLAFDFAKRELKAKYVGTSIGQFWYLLSPLIMIFIYSVIFSDFMKMKLDIVDNSYAYSIYLIPGLLAWTSFSTIVMRLNNSFLEKANLIKKINVPMYSFQLGIVLSELFMFFISMLLGVIFLVIVKQPITVEFLWLPIIMVLQTIFAFGIGVIFSLFTPFFKDLKEIIPIIIQLWFWMTPIIYLNTMLQNKYPKLLIYNPIYYFIEVYQNIFLFAKPPSIDKILIVLLLSFTTLFIAIYFYKKMVSTIKDII